MNRQMLRTAIACLVLAGCAPELAAPTRGILELTISGLPSSQAAAVTITGPDSFNRSVTATVTIPDLVPGSYTIAAANVTSGSTTYLPVIGSQTVVVAASRT